MEAYTPPPKHLHDQKRVLKFQAVAYKKHIQGGYYSAQSGSSGSKTFRLMLETQLELVRRVITASIQRDSWKRHDIYVDGHAIAIRSSLSS